MSDELCNECGCPQSMHCRDDEMYRCPSDRGGHDSPAGSVLLTSINEQSELHPVAHEQEQCQQLLALRKSPRLEALRLAREGKRKENFISQPSLKTVGSHPRSPRRSRHRRLSVRPIGQPNDQKVLSSRTLGALEVRRANLQARVLRSLVPVEEMESISGFQPFTELEPGTQTQPVTIREPPQETPGRTVHHVWNPTIAFPDSGGMLIRTGHFEPVDPTEQATEAQVESGEGVLLPTPPDAEQHLCLPLWYQREFASPAGPDSGIEAGDGFSSQLWQGPEFVQGSSKSAPPPAPLKSAGAEFPELDAIIQHYEAVQVEMAMSLVKSPLNQARSFPANPPMGLAEPLPALARSPLHQPRFLPSATEPLLSNPMSQPFPTCHPGCQIQCNFESASIAPQSATFPQAHQTQMQQTTPLMHSPVLAAAHVTQSPMAATPKHLPGVLPEAAQSSILMTEVAVSPQEDWAAREPWWYIHRVLTSATRRLVAFLRLPRERMTEAVQGAAGADLRYAIVSIQSDQWLLFWIPEVGAVRDTFPERLAASPPVDFVTRVGGLRWGVHIDEIEIELSKAVEEAWRAGSPVPTLPAQFMPGHLGGMLVWYQSLF
ncbi:hypothetical protein BC834DRAFT_1040246 [Gloeopeniophorella convolvens]|nr:hypothetical protein BC834DRAFT_1040246 [Gloeopeniophorella convolvens]